MIEKIIFKKNIQHDLSYISELPSIVDMGGVIEFKKGINVIVGPNGSGKSSILKAIGDMFAASQYGESCLSKSYLMNEVLNRKEKELFKFPFDVIHDGQAVIYGDPKREMGISNGDVDKEFISGGLLEKMAMSKESSGEQSNRRMTPFFDILKGLETKPKGLGSTFDPDELNDVYLNALKVYVDKVFTPKIKKSQMTVLLDEPENSLDMINQLILWNKIFKNKKISDNFQIILVSHSKEALNIKGANYIETKKGFLDICRKLIEDTIPINQVIDFTNNFYKN